MESLDASDAKLSAVKWHQNEWESMECYKQAFFVVE